MDTDELNSGTTSARTKVEFHRSAFPAICVHLCSSVANSGHEETSGGKNLSGTRSGGAIDFFLGTLPLSG
jgi:hypothetical protein